MVKDSWLPPSEVKKPIETVYEIKTDYEVPSFEEFMKSYQADENLNYDDLSGGDIGEVKGYGPCYVCRLPTKWVILKVVCPANECPDKFKQREPSEWVHSGCWGDIEISIQGTIRCKRCYTSDFMGNWNFACSAHQGQHLPTSHSTFKNAIRVSMDVGNTGEEDAFHLYQFVKAHPEKFVRR